MMVFRFNIERMKKWERYYRTSHLDVKKPKPKPKIGNTDLVASHRILQSKFREGLKRKRHDKDIEEKQFDWPSNVNSTAKWGNASEEVYIGGVPTTLEQQLLLKLHDLEMESLIVNNKHGPFGEY